MSAIAPVPLPAALQTEPARSADLVRGLGAWSASAILVGTMIGTGIYLKPAEIAREAGSLEWALFAWVAGAALTLLGALVYLELATMMPAAGADYEYLRRGLGPLWGFLYGWKGTIVQGPASAAALAAGLALFAQAIWPSLDANVLAAGPLVINGRELVAIAAIATVCAINLLAVNRVGQTQVVLTAIKVLVLVLVIGLGVSYRGPEPRSAVAVTGPSVGGVMAAVAASLWVFSGWQTLLRVGSEIRDPERVLPRAMIGAFSATAVLFLLINIACFKVLGFDTVAGSPHPATDVIDRVTGGGFAALFAGAMLFSAFGSMNASLLGSSRVVYAMARDGLLPRRLAATGIQSRSPQVAVVYTAGFAMVLVLTGTFEDLTALFVFTQWLFFGLGGLALFRLRRLEPDTPRPVKAWGYPVVPMVFITLAVALTVSVVIDRPVRSLIGLVLIAAGLPVYVVLSRRNQGPGQGPARAAPPPPPC